MKSTITNSDEIQQPIYEDPDALLPAVIHGDQPEVKAKPVPAPRSKLYPKTQHNSTSNNADSSNAYESTTTEATYSEYAADYKSPKPVRPAPKPPVTSEKHTETIKGRSPRPKAPKPPALHIENNVPPPPPPRPAGFPGSPHYCDKPCSSMSLRYENTSECQSRHSSVSYTDPTSVSPSQDSLSLSAQIRPPPSPRSEYGGLVYTEKHCQYLEILPDNSDGMDVNGLLSWFKRMSKSDFMAPSLCGLSKEDEMRSFNQRAMNVTKAQRLYNLLMMKCKEELQNIIADFKSICDHLSKIKKKSKTMGIAGGTTGAVGGVAAVVGIALAPVTMGTSLIVTAVGAGMIASAGGMGAHAAIVNKKMVTRAAVEKLVNDYREGVADLERCLDFILSAMKELQRHDITRLKNAGAHPDAVRMGYKSFEVLSNMGTSGGTSAHPGGMTSEKLLQAFTKEMDQYFTEKNGQKLKKSNKSIFSGKVFLLTDGLQERLNHLINMWEKLF